MLESILAERWSVPPGSTLSQIKYGQSKMTWQRQLGKLTLLPVNTKLQATCSRNSSPNSLPCCSPWVPLPNKSLLLCQLKSFLKDLYLWHPIQPWLLYPSQRQKDKHQIKWSEHQREREGKYFHTHWKFERVHDQKHLKPKTNKKS